MSRNDFLRNVMGCTLKNQIRNRVILHKLNIFNLNENIQNNRQLIDWRNKIHSTSEVTLERTIYLTEKRKRSKP
jgi:hypothetical protein